MDISRLLGDIASGAGQAADLVTIQKRLGTVADGARCSLATQHQTVIGSLLRVFDGQVRAHLEPGFPAVQVHLVAELTSIDDQGAHSDASFAKKQPDWSYGASESGKTPVDRFTDHRADEPDGSS